MTIKNTAVSISSYLLYLLPFTLLTGNFIPDLLIVLINLFVLYAVVSQKDWAFFKNYFFYFFLIFYLYILFVSAFSEDPFFSFKSTIPYIRFGILPLAIAYLIRNNKKLIQTFSIFFLVSFLFALADGYFQFFFETSFFGFESKSANRLTLPLNEKLFLGGYLSRLFPLMLALLIYSFSYSKKGIIFICILLVLTDVLIYITGERTALGLLFLSTLLIIFMLSKYKLLRIFTLSISIVLIFLISIFSPSIKERNIDYTLQQLNIINGNSNQIDNTSSQKNILSRIYIFSEEHQGLFSSAHQMFQKNIIFGVGPNMFRKLCNNDEYYSGRHSCSTHPHHSYIQLAAETGIIGLMLLILVFCYISFVIFKHLYLSYFGSKMKLNDYQVCLISCIFISLWPFLPTLNFFNGYINIIYFLPIGFYLQSNSFEK